MKFDDQLFLGKRSTKGLKRKRLPPKPRPPDGPDDPIIGGGYATMRAQNGQKVNVPMTYGLMTLRAQMSMRDFDRAAPTPWQRLDLEQRADANYSEEIKTSQR